MSAPRDTLPPSDDRETIPAPPPFAPLESEEETLRFLTLFEQLEVFKRAREGSYLGDSRFSTVAGQRFQVCA